MKQTLTFFLLFTAILFTSCNSSKSIRLKDSSDSKKNSGNANLVITQKIDNASIVHIDQSQRIVTIRSNSPLETGYYITSSQYSEKENSIIKLNKVSYESLIIADILEGTPKITDIILRVSEQKSKELDAYYTEATID